MRQDYEPVFALLRGDAMDLKKIKILYIEDNPADVILIRESLMDQNALDFDIEGVDRLSAGLERLSQGGIDLVLLDLSLPDSRGLQTFLTFKNWTKNVPTIVMTSTDDENLAIRAVREGAQDYLIKGRLDVNLLVRAFLYAIEREKLVTRLRDALEQIKTLRGLIPICAACKNIRDDQGFWHQVEEYVHDHSEADFSHSICPNCAQRLYPEFYDKS